MAMTSHRFWRCSACVRSGVSRNRQVTGVEVIPLAELQRPRIDVTTRISGFFRDAFPQLIDLIDDAVNAVIQLDEPLDQNFVRKNYLKELGDWMGKGLSGEDAKQRAGYRIFRRQAGHVRRGHVLAADSGS
jgi:cobaltochelatase CobN